MIATANFGEQQFHILLGLLHPFDLSFPEIHEHVDEFLYKLADAMSNGGAYESLEEFRAIAVENRKHRAVRFHDKWSLCVTLAPLFGLTRSAALRFPELGLQVDRLNYEISRAIDAKSFQNTPFEIFHREQQLLRSAINSKMRGVG